MANFDIVLDTLLRLQNAGRVNKATTQVMKSGLVKAILSKLVERKFIIGFTEEANAITVELRYDRNGNHLLHGVEKISKLGRRLYTSYNEIVPVFGGRGMYIVSTPKGVLTGEEAKAQKQGGELICKVW